jgi:penicillin-binding protein 2
LVKSVGDSGKPLPQYLEKHYTTIDPAYFSIAADHSVFIAFAPKENPRIAVSVYVEYSGQGARAAAAIASLMIEKYLLGATERPQVEEYVLKGKFL